MIRFLPVGGKVIIIIGGDDNYRSEDEEDRVVISGWAQRKMLSQFSDEFLDGSKSFIFSWNKKHRETHEEALLHYFDSSKKGKKFEYQPKPRQPESVQSAQAASERTPSRRDHSTDEQKGREVIGSSNPSNTAQKRHGFASSPSYSAYKTSEHSDSDVKPGEVSHLRRSDHRRDDNFFSHRSSTEQSLFTEQQREGNIFSDSRNADQRRDSPSLRILGYVTSRINKAPVHLEQRAFPTETEQRRHGFASRPSYSADQTSEHSDSDHSKDAKPGEVSHLRRSDHRRDDNFFSHRCSTDQSLFTEQQREGNIFSDSRNADQRRDSPSLRILGYVTSRINKAPVHLEQRALPTKTEG